MGLMRDQDGGYHNIGGYVGRGGPTPESVCERTYTDAEIAGMTPVEGVPLEFCEPLGVTPELDVRFPWETENAKGIAYVVSLLVAIVVMLYWLVA